jgi:hypothetical protein
MYHILQKDFGLFFSIINRGEQNFFTTEQANQKVELKCKLTLDRLEKLDIAKAYLADFYAKRFHISVDQKVPLHQIKTDAKWLFNYLDLGGSLKETNSFRQRFFSSKELKKRLYISQDITLDGKPCTTKERIELLIRQCEIQQEIADVAAIWNVEAMEFESTVKKYRFLKNITVVAQEMLEAYKKGTLAVYQLISEEGLLL